MAHLILEEHETGTESAYIEFNPADEEALCRMESVLKARYAKNRPTVEQLGEIAVESMRVTCNKHSTAGWTTRIAQALNELRFGKTCILQESSC